MLAQTFANIIGFGTFGTLERSNFVFLFDGCKRTFDRLQHFNLLGFLNGIIQTRWRHIRMIINQMSILLTRIQKYFVTIFAAGHGHILIMSDFDMFPQTIGQFVFFVTIATLVKVVLRSVFS